MPFYLIIAIIIFPAYWSTVLFDGPSQITQPLRALPRIELILLAKIKTLAFFCTASSFLRIACPIVYHHSRQ